jgi:hypothetical protein
LKSEDLALSRAGQDQQADCGDSGRRCAGRFGLAERFAEAGYLYLGEEPPPVSFLEFLYVAARVAALLAQPPALGEREHRRGEP